MWPDRPLALIKLGIKEAFDQLYRSRVAAALEAGSVAPEVALGLMHQMTGAKVMLVVGGRCCQEVPVERGIHQGRPESMDHFVLVLCYCLEACPNMVRVDIGGMLLAAWAYADDLFWAAGAAWKLTRMLSDQFADLLRLRLSLCTEMGKCAWLGIGIDDRAPVYLAGNLVTRVTSFCVLAPARTTLWCRCSTERLWHGAILEAEGTAPITRHLDEITTGAGPLSSYADTSVGC